ncbi:MAG: proline--tRNA ligase [Treponema sp.]
MKMSKMYLPTLKEVPQEAQIKSHKLLLRAGMIRALGNGLFAYLPLGLLVFRKIENIIREEMNNIGCLEFKPSVVVPGALWQESGRWDAMGPELLRFKNRLNQDMVLSPTAEEVFTSLLRFEASSYKSYPILTYQINTKFRDEIRPRYGLMRAREFTMKDAYSFHVDETSLDEIYNQFVKAYQNIFSRVGLATIEVRADSGAMGGKDSQEFMVESEIGDDTLLLCPSCRYSANEEKAACFEEKVDICLENQPEIKEVSTPNIKSIDVLSSFLNCSPKACIKAIVYHVENSSITKASTIFLCIRGDLEVNEAKLKSFLKATDVHLEDEEVILKKIGCEIGFLGPIGLNKEVPLFCDESVMNMPESGITGALKKDTHLLNVFPLRDFKPDFVGDFRIVKEGDACPSCHAKLYSKKGNELGHVFKLGDKYSRSMDMGCLDANGKKIYPLMGCYGIGLDRLMAAVAEQYSDDDGLKWPASIAPYMVAIVPVKYEGKIKEQADLLYEELKQKGVEVLLDDRNERVGVKFKDMDLIGIPIRLVISEKTLPNIEVKYRETGNIEVLSKDNVINVAVSMTRLKD